VCSIEFSQHAFGAHGSGGLQPESAARPRFLDIPTVHEQKKICISGFMGEIGCGEMFLLFQNPATEEPKNKKKMKKNCNKS